MPLMIRCLIVPLTLAAIAFHPGQAFAQDEFPAQLPNQTDASASDASPYPLVKGGAPVPFPSNGAAPISGSLLERDACMNGFTSLREEAEVRGKLIKATSERRAAPDEACRLIGNFGQAEIKLIKYVEANATKCRIQPGIADQLRAAHKTTEAMQRKVCAVAQQAQSREPAGPVGDFDHIGAPPLVR